MLRNGNKGVSLIELVVSLGVSAIAIVLFMKFSGDSIKLEKQAEMTERSMEAFDNSMSKKDRSLMTSAQINLRGQKICASMGLTYLSIAGNSACYVTKYTNCPKNKNPCYVDLKTALCDLEVRARVPDSRFCN